MNRVKIKQFDDPRKVADFINQSQLPVIAITEKYERGLSIFTLFYSEYQEPIRLRKGASFDINK